MSSLIIGYGNIDRGDDGVAWYVMSELKRRIIGDSYISDDGDIVSINDTLDILFTLQLTPEMALDISSYQRVCFIDSHTGRVEDDFHTSILQPVYEPSPFTHHLTPQSCLALAENFYGNSPSAWMISIRGYNYNFERKLSQKTLHLVDKAVTFLLDWVQTVD